MAEFGTMRPYFEPDWDIIDELLKIQCTGKEIAGVFDVCYSTIERACKRDKGVTFKVYSESKREGGKSSLRRAQWLAAVEDRNPAMLKHLGNNVLGQRDRHDVTSVGVEISHDEWVQSVIEAEKNRTG